MRSQRSKRILLSIGGAVGFLILVALAAPLFVDVNRYKPRLEATASEVIGMDVRVGGRLGLAFFPSLRVTVEGGQILGDQGVAVASAKETSLWIEMLPLLRRELRLRKVQLTQPRLSIERDSVGRLNVERLRAAALLSALVGASVSLADGTLSYADRKSGARFEATDFDLTVSRLRLARERSPQLLSGLSLKAELTCEGIRSKKLSASALKVSVDGKDGVFELEPATMRIFGGQAAGSIRADATGPVPLYQVHCSLPRFRIEEFLKTLSPNRAAEGAMDFSTSLSMQGRTGSELVQSAAGEMSLQGGPLMLVGHDLDREISRFKSSQSFNLVDVGAIFFAGPLGLAVTKGYNFGSLFQGSGGSSRIGTLVSHWKVQRGVAQAKDVAMATSENRIALQGGLDFVNGRFADVTVAVINAKGCAKVRQRIRGPFGKPEVEPPDLLKSIAGPVLKLYKKAKGLFPSEPCEVFYSGSVAPPR
jgi:AsmA protein